MNAPRRLIAMAAVTLLVLLGVFGAPAYVYQGELFWGQDRLLMLEWRLTQRSGKDTGGFRFG